MTWSAHHLTKIIVRTVIFQVMILFVNSHHCVTFATAVLCYCVRHRLYLHINLGKKGHGSSYIPMRLAVDKSNSSMWLSTSSMNLATSSLFVYLDPSLQKTRQQKNKADPSLHPLVKRVSYYTNGRMWLWRGSPNAKIWLTWSQTPATCLLQSCLVVWCQRIPATQLDWRGKLSVMHH